MRPRVLAVVAVLVLLGACSEDGVLEKGGARVPDDFGVATDVTFERIELDGERTYDIDDSVESFATRSHRITSLLSWEGKYVHVGLDDQERAVWIAGIGIVSGKPERVTYSGVFESYDEEQNRGSFEDGTVLQFAGTVDPPDPGREVVVEIDVDEDRVIRIR